MSFLSHTLIFLLPYAGWGLVLYLIFSLLVTRNICKKWGREALQKTDANEPGSATLNNQGAGCFGFFIVLILFTSLSTAAVLMPLAIAERVSVFIVGQAYQAKIVSVYSHSEQVKREDNNGRSHTEIVMMHTPVYGFTLADGSMREVQGDVSSESEPTIGTIQRIYYDAASRRLVTASISNVLMLLCMSIFAFIFILMFYATLCYAFNRKNDGVLRLLGRSFFGLALPLGMALMASGLGYYVFQRFNTNLYNDHPYIVAGFAAFFSLTLASTCIVFIRKFWSKSDVDL